MSATIRLASASDANQISAIYRHFVLNTPISFESEPPDVAETSRRIEAILTNYPWLVCEADGFIAGYAYASQHRARFHYQWSVDVTVYVHESFRRRRVAYALYTSLFSILPLQGFVMAHAGITLPNEGSIALHEAVGFLPIGIYRNVGYKLGRWHDVGWWQKSLCVPPFEPGNPVNLEQAQASLKWQQALTSGLEHLTL